MVSKKNSKAKAMKAIMDHPGSMKMLKDAIKSPIGSTSRSQAQKIFRIIDKLYTQNDGAGGPGIMMEQQQQALQSLSAPNNVSKEPQGIIIFHKLPPMKVDFSGKKKKTAYNGMGGAGFDGEGGVGDWLSGALNSFKSAIGINNTASASTPTPSITSSRLGMSSANPFINTPSYNPWPVISSAPSRSVNTVTSTPATSSPSASIPSEKYPGLFSSSFWSEMGQNAQKLGKGLLDTAIGGVSAITAPFQWASSNLLKSPIEYTGQVLNSLVGNQKIGEPNPTWKYYPLSETPAAKTISDIISRRWPNVGGVSEAAVANKPVSDKNISMTGPNKPLKTGFTPVANSTGEFYGPENPNRNWSNIINNISPTSEIIASAIKQVESGGDYNKVGKSGEVGAYQFRPETWSQYSKEYTNATGDDATLLTPGNEDKVATWKINQWLSQGYKADQIASLWNSGNPNYLGNVGINDKGVAYDTPAYVSKVMDVLTGEQGTLSGMSNIPDYSGALGYYNDINSILGGASTGNVSGTPGAYTGTLGKFAPSDIHKAAQAAVASNVGAAAFANDVINNPNNPETQGLSMAEAMAKKEADIWDKYNITDLQKEQIALRNAQNLLPTEVSAYINGRDEYLNQTNEMIKDYVEEIKNKPMSDTERAQATAHLNYLYTLRGMQNRNYMQYMNDAVTENEAKLQNVTDTLSMNLNNYQRELNSSYAITEDQYKTMAESLMGMYNSLENAEVKALQTQLLKYQVLDAYTTATTDPIKADAQSGYIEQSKKLEGHITKDRLLLPGVDLIDSLNKFYSLDPTIGQGNIIAAYTDGVNNVLNALPGTKIGDTEINDNYKIEVGKKALEDFGKYTASAFQIDANGEKRVPTANMSTYNNGLANAQQISQVLANKISEKISNPETIKKAIEVIKSLNATGWFSHKPSRSEFINNMVKKTNSMIDGDMAAAIYDNYLEQTQAGDSDADYVNSMLYNMMSTENRAGTGETTMSKVAFTNDQIAYNIAEIYCNWIFYNALNSTMSRLNQEGATVSM